MFLLSRKLEIHRNDLAARAPTAVVCFAISSSNDPFVVGRKHDHCQMPQPLLIGKAGRLAQINNFPVAFMHSRWTPNADDKHDASELI